MRTQGRVGYLLACMACITYIGNFLARLFTGAPMGPMLSFHHIHFLFYGIIFVFTANKINQWTSLIQISIIIIESMISLTLNPDEWFFGAVLMILAILLAYAYGLLSTNKKYKIPIIALAQYLSFIFIPLANNPDKYIRAFQWLAFISSFIFSLWFIFKDKIERLSIRDSEARQRLYNLLGQSMRATENAISIGEEALIELKKLTREDT